MSKKILIVGTGNVGLHASEKIKALGFDPVLIDPLQVSEALETESYLPTTNHLILEDKMKTYKITEQYNFSDNLKPTRRERRANQRKKKKL